MSGSRISLSFRKRAEYGFGEYGFKHRAQWAFKPSSSLGGRVSSSQPIICVSKRTHQVARINSPSLPSMRLSEFSSPKQYSRNSIPPVSHLSVIREVTHAAVFGFQLRQLRSRLQNAYNNSVLEAQWASESALLNRESSDSESCDSKVALSIDTMRFGWRFRIDSLRFYFIAIRLVFLASRWQLAEFLAIPDPRFWESCDSRFAIRNSVQLSLEECNWSHNCSTHFGGLLSL